MEYRKIYTSAEVWAVIKAKHGRDLKVFSSYSAPDGDQLGDPDKCVMMTEYGFDNAPCPLVGAETTWDRGHDGGTKRENESHKYWLCMPVED